MASDPLYELQAAWEQWDRRPSDSTRVERMCNAVNAVAELRGVTGTELRIELTERRRSTGKTIAGVVAELVEQRAAAT